MKLLAVDELFLKSLVKSTHEGTLAFGLREIFIKECS